MTARLQAILRLLAVQAAWTYERMTGIGVGHAAAPLLKHHLSSQTREARLAAVARSAEFFNSHPYLAGVAVGAVVRAEKEGVPGSTIIRLRTALSGPLGALGDQLVWAGQVPALMGLSLAALPWFGGWAVLVAVIVHNVLRLALTAWGLDLQRSWLPRRADDAQRLAAFAVGLAVPVAAWFLVANVATNAAIAVMLVGGLGAMLALAPQTRTHVTGVRFGLVLVVVSLLVVGGSR